MSSEKGMVQDDTASTASLEQTSTQKEQGTASNDSSERKFEEIRQVKKEEYDLARARINRLKSLEKIECIVSIVFAVVMSSYATYLRYRTNDLYLPNNQFDRYYVYFFIVFAIGLFATLFVLFKAFSQMRYSILKEKIDLYEFENLQEEVEENLFESSLKMSYKYLDQYYAQTREQARNGFLITISVTVAGAVLLGVGIICMYFDKTDAPKITVASGVIVEFISAIMFYLYNRTVQSMGNYHDKLFLSQNVAMALKISDSLSDAKRDDIKSQIVKELITDVNSYIVISDNKKENNEKTKEG